MLNVDFYHKVNSQCPVKEYLDSLSPNLEQKHYVLLCYQRSLERTSGCHIQLRQAMVFLNFVLLQEMTLQEFFIFLLKGIRQFLTNGFTKKTQKTPVQEIEKANQYRADYYEQNRSKE